MTSPQRRWAADLLHFWFQELDSSDWFKSSDEVDQQLQARFADDWQRLHTQPADSFMDDADTAQAAILLFDQVPRNIFRDTAKAFASDPLAREITRAFIANGWDAHLPSEQRQFVAMPLMHSEDLPDQEACVAYFGLYLPKNLSFARNHHEMIAKFGRFPHRNALLDRDTTAAEQEAIDSGFSW